MLGWTARACVVEGSGQSWGSHGEPQVREAGLAKTWAPASYLVVSPAGGLGGCFLSLRTFFIPIRKMGSLGPACSYWMIGDEDEARQRI